MVGCESRSEHEPKLAAAEQNLKNTIDAVNYEQESKWLDVWIDSVGLDQGEAVGMRFLLDCQQKGYRLHFGTTDANGFTPAIGDSTGGPPSRRLKAECDSIIAKENRIKSKRAAREKAEEKRKDEAYDKAHPTH
jgi:hypothetical protein